MEIRNSHYTDALKLMHRVTTPPARKINYHDDAEQVQTRVHKSLKVYFKIILCFQRFYKLISFIDLGFICGP